MLKKNKRDMICTLILMFSLVIDISRYFHSIQFTFDVFFHLTSHTLLVCRLHYINTLKHFNELPVKFSVCVNEG